MGLRGQNVGEVTVTSQEERGSVFVRVVWQERWTASSCAIASYFQINMAFLMKMMLPLSGAAAWKLVLGRVVDLKFSLVIPLVKIEGCVGIVVD